MTDIFNDHELAFLAPVMQRLGIPREYNLSVTQLQSILKDLHLPHGGRKADLIARLKQYITAMEAGAPVQTRGVPGIVPFTQDELDYLEPFLRQLGIDQRADFTVDQLRRILRELRLDHRGNKDVLVRRLHEYIAEQRRLPPALPPGLLTPPALPPVTPPPVLPPVTPPPTLPPVTPPPIRRRARRTEAIFTPAETLALLPYLEELGIPEQPNYVVPQLQRILGRLHLDNRGLKDTLINRIREAIAAGHLPPVARRRPTLAPRIPVSPPRRPVSPPRRPPPPERTWDQLTREEKMTALRERVRTNALNEDPPRSYIKTTQRVYNMGNPVEVARMLKVHRRLEGLQTRSLFTYAIEPILLNGEAFRNQVLHETLEFPFDDQLIGTSDDKITLLWSFYIYSNVNSPFTEPQRTFITTLSNEELIDLLGPDYVYPRTNRADLLWAVMYRYAPPVPDATQEPKYAQVLRLEPAKVLDLNEFVYNYYGEERTTNGGDRGVLPSLHSPYRFLALQPTSVLEPFILQYNGDVDAFATAIHMVFPNPQATRADKERYYFENLRYYGDIFTRPEDILPPPPLAGMGDRQIKDILRIYTDDELIDAYEVTRWTSRPDLINKIVEDARGGAKWQFRKRNCGNDDRFNVLTIERRDKNDPTDPILSYGTLNNYRCYNRDELIVSFREDETGFHFYIPDWLRVDGPIKEFPVTSIRQLQTLLNDLPAQAQVLYRPLIEKVNEGLDALNNVVLRVRGLRRQYEAMSPDERQIVQEYLTWIFLAGMYARHWKGPGNPFPHEWIERGGGPDRCDDPTRERNFQQQCIIEQQLLERIPPALREWLLALPRVEYTFQTGAARLGREALSYVIERACAKRAGERGATEEAKMCLGDVSNRLTGSGYYLIKQIFNLPTDAEFNRFIRTQIQTPAQPAFDPTRLRGTGHIDPWINLVEAE